MAATSGRHTSRFAGSERWLWTRGGRLKGVRFGAAESDFALHQRKRRIDDLTTDWIAAPRRLADAEKPHSRAEPA